MSLKSLPKKIGANRKAILFTIIGLLIVGLFLARPFQDSLWKIHTHIERVKNEWPGVDPHLRMEVGVSLCYFDVDRTSSRLFLNSDLDMEDCKSMYKEASEYPLRCFLVPDLTWRIDYVYRGEVTAFLYSPFLGSGFVDKGYYGVPLDDPGRVDCSEWISLYDIED